MVGRSTLKDLGIRATHASRHTAIKPEGDQPACHMRRLTWPNILEAGEFDRAHGIKVPDDRGRTAERLHDVEQLPPVQELPMRQVDVCQGDVAYPYDLRYAGGTRPGITETGRGSA